MCVQIELVENGDTAFGFFFFLQMKIREVLIAGIICVSKNQKTTSRRERILLDLCSVNFFA